MTGGRDNEPVPGLVTGSEAEPGPLLYRLDVDGEIFEVRRGHAGGTNYDWISGPNEGYGFGSSGPEDLPEASHRESIRNFLGMIDPQTGYIADD